MLSNSTSSTLTPSCRQCGAFWDGLSITLKAGLRHSAELFTLLTGHWTG